ncbi:ribonuclease Z [Chlorobium sp. N1]|uniref:MBL fold metallo-hydrolase n=1 Tax=Chlorobium sp. N1 TaxID=2491138 RepID=UPI00103D9F8E|nr:ribonuclease Z [Chlorobium sp. N1]TCD47962.1 ribonuclease Z [Chlorobium sp. N1]
MKVVFLGTNGWYDSPTGNTVCILVETARAFMLLDAGSGLHKADRYLKADKPVHLFLSHLHLDHIIGLHLLNKFDMPEGLTIHCQNGDLEHLKAVIAPPYSMPFSALSYPVDFIEHDGATLDTDGFTVRSAPMRHSVPTIGFRIETEGKTLAYCPDTGYCDSAVELSKDADLLIAECAFRPGEEDERWPHLNPESAARLAHDAGAKKLVLVHFDAYRYPDLEMRRRAESASKRVFTETSIAIDNQAYAI